ncbi:SGNH/GDSL hydrolase family protein [Serratia liquefaciens]|uniref:SGNH/GDSL hydrolase family protein n=1 Tax=Serratia liquefaciens TaxID=614 RepID=UPI0018D641F1|nr:SGNH/GDSL hydrolase family protein [Serratia liquefaciens]MBH2810181.1 SGNH/GDSL hydrolase family protein [Serratia liquefaciens]
MAQRYNTGNQRPSNSMKDLNDNALAYDDFLNSDEDEAVDRLQRPFPTVRKQVAVRINEIIGAQQDAEVYAKQAKQSAEDAKSIADANTYYITPEDPDGTIAGIAGTPNEEMFRVAVPEASGSIAAFNIYKNSNGVAEYITSQPNAKYVEEARDTAETAEVRARGFRTVGFSDPDQVSNIVLEHVSVNGVCFMYQDDRAKSHFPYGADVRDATAKSVNFDGGTRLVSTDGDKYLGAETGSDGNTIWGTDPTTARKIYLNRALFNTPGQLLGDCSSSGDSISAASMFNGAFKPLSWQMWASLNTNCRIRIDGIYATAGMRTDQILATHIPQVVAARNTFNIHMSGRNDIVQGEEIAGNLDKYLDEVTIPSFIKIFETLLLAGIIPVVCTMAAQGNSTSATQRAGEHKLNNWLRAYARKQKLPFIDLHKATVDPATGDWLPGYNKIDEDGNPDPSHPSETGAKAMGKALSDALEAWTSPVYPTIAEEQIAAGLTNNLLANPLFYTLNGAGDAPDGWTTVTAGTSSIAPDPEGKGNIWTLRNSKRTKQITLTPGDKLGFGFFIKSNADVQFEFYIAQGSASSTNYLAGMRTWNKKVDGFSYFYQEFVVPAGVTTATLVISCGAVDINTKQIGLFKL